MEKEAFEFGANRWRRAPLRSLLIYLLTNKSYLNKALSPLFSLAELYLNMIILYFFPTSFISILTFSSALGTSKS